MKQKKSTTKLETSKNQPQIKIEKRGRKKKNVANKEKYYVDPIKLKELIIEYYKNPILKDELAEMVSKICHNLSFAPNFINYTFKDEMIGDAIIKCLNALKNKNVDPHRGNSFWYFTIVAYNAFRNRIKKEKQDHKTILDYQNEVYNSMIDRGFLPSSQSTENNDEDYEYD